MNHDELLDRIAQEGLKPDGNVLNTKLVLALRAVVELHKPVDVDFGHIISQIECANCEVKYPCPSIKAVEAELK